MSSDDAFLAAAAAIGARIAGDAVWHDGVCSWVGAAADRTQPWRVEYRGLDPSLYEGTAGVGLFLSQLAAVTGDAAARRTAVGAMRHAVGRTALLPPGRRDGFHAGSLGVAWAAARAAVLLDEEELLAGARTLPAPAARADRCPDVIEGAAGAIIALLALAEAFDEPVLVGDAAAAGEQLIGRAAIPGRRHEHHRCGLAHGAAGIGWALLELFAATGDERFRESALGAFAYERSWLDTGSGAWADPSASWPVAPAAGTWCHGEGGIALTRLRAIAVLGPEAVGRDAELALETTRRTLAEALPYEIEDLTLCHGAAGAAEVLLCAADALGGRWRETAADLGRVALERGAASANGGATPGLMRGLSGIGWWFLRLHDAEIPSPLTLPLGRLTAAPEGA